MVSLKPDGTSSFSEGVLEEAFPVPVDRDNSVLDKKFIPMTKDQIRDRTELGGIIREYYRDPA